PDLTEAGYVQFDCADATAPGLPRDATADGDFRSACWRGSPDVPFYQAVNAIAIDIRNATEAVRITEQVCPPAVLNGLAGVTCEALRFGSESDGAVLGIAASLVDPAGTLGDLGEDPTQWEVDQALEGAVFEIFIATDQIVTSP